MVSACGVLECDVACRLTSAAVQGGVSRHVDASVAATLWRLTTTTMSTKASVRQSGKSLLTQFFDIGSVVDDRIEASTSSEASDTTCTIVVESKSEKGKARGNGSQSRRKQWRKSNVQSSVSPSVPAEGNENQPKQDSKCSIGLSDFPQHVTDGTWQGGDLNKNGKQEPTKWTFTDAVAWL